MWEFLVLLVATFIAPVLLDQSNKRKHFEWVGPWLKEGWALVFAFFVSYVLYSTTGEKIAMKLHPFWRLHPWVGYLLFGAIGAVIFSSYWWFIGRIVSGDSLPHEKQRLLYVDLSREKTARLKAYRDDCVANLNYVAMGWQLRNPGLNPAIRKEAEIKRAEFLAKTDKTYEAVEAEEQKFAAILAEIRIHFPDSPQLQAGLTNAARRPLYAVEAPTKPKFPTDSAKKFLDSEGDKINDILERSCSKPVDALLDDMNKAIDRKN